jgi:hypothetical protein
VPQGLSLDDNNRYRGWVKDESRKSVEIFLDEITVIKCKVVQRGKRWQGIQSGKLKTWTEGIATYWAENK